MDDNFPQPDVASQFEFVRNLFCVTLGALLCDMLISLPKELTFMKSGISPVMVAYILSRSSTLALVVLSVIAKSYPEKHCKSQELGVAFLWIISSASSAFLFLKRAHAIFHQRRFCRYFYSCLYVVNVGISSVVPIGNKAVPLGQTGWCANSKVAPYVSAAIFSRLLFDSCIFLGISYQVATTQRLSGVGVTWRTIVTGKSSSRLSRSLLRGGQQYYLISVCSNLVISLLVIIPGVPAIYQAMINVPDIALSSSMACRVFRNLKISASHAEAMSIEFPTLEASDSGTATGNIDGDNNLNA